MNPITFLTSNVSDLWIWTYSIIAGWGTTVTLLVVAMGYLLVRLIRLEQRLRMVDNKLMSETRDLSLRINKHTNTLG
jgi:hypothetical protein